MLTQLFLSLIDVLDSYGAKTWNLRAVAAASAVVLYATYRLGRSGGQQGGKSSSNAKVGGVCWEGLLHATVSGVGSAICVYLNHFAAVDISGESEPLRSIRCDGDDDASASLPLTSLHRILPAITLGYGLCDIIEGLDLGRDFLLHATALVIVMGTCCEMGYSHTVTPMLLMEISSIWLNLSSATFISETTSVVFQLLFASSFFVIRIWIVPYLWLEWVWTLVREEREGYSICFHWSFKYFVVMFGFVFNGLNFYWMYKIIRKIKRKLSGKEKMAEADLKDR